MEEKNEIKEEKKTTGLKVTIVVLVILLLGAIGFIAYNKVDIFSNTKENETKYDGKKDSNEISNNIESNEIKDLDISKCLNNPNGNKYSNQSDSAGNYGLSMAINSDKKSITLSINWDLFGPISTASTWTSQTTTTQITGFNKNIVNIFVGELGQDPKGVTLFYIMEDGTVEYTPVFLLKKDTQNNSYYVVNYTNEYTSDGRVSGSHFESKGTISGVNNVVKLYNVDVSNQAGWRSTIGATKDGSFYDLGAIIKNN